MMLKIVACAIATGLGVLVLANVAHAQDAQDLQTVRIDANTAMVCGPRHEMSAGSGQVRDCRMVKLTGSVVKTVRGSK